MGDFRLWLTLTLKKKETIRMPVQDEDVLDLSDPRYDTVYEGDPEADQNAFVVVPDGVHVASISYQEDKSSYAKEYHDARADEDKVMLIAPLQISIQAEGEKYNGGRLKDWATSLISFRSGTSTIGDICRLAKQPHAKGLTTKALKQHFDDLIAGEPLLKVKTQWEGSCETCRKKYVDDNPDDLSFAALKKASNKFANKAALAGMRNWPSDGREGFLSEIQCPDCGEAIQARPIVKKYLALS